MKPTRIALAVLLCVQIAGALAFCNQTRFMAPGKSDARGEHTYEERLEAWDKWTRENASLIRCFVAAANELLVED